MGVVSRAWLTFRMLAFTKQKYLYRQSQYIKLWIGKCHTAIAQRLGHSACSRGSWVRVPLGACYLSLKKIDWFMMTSSMFSASLALCGENPPVTGALMFPLISASTNAWANHGNANDLRPHRAHYDVTVMQHFADYHLRNWLSMSNGVGEYVPPAGELGNML